MRAVCTACGSSAGWSTAAATLSPWTTATFKLFRALGTTLNTSVRMIPSAASLAGPVTDAAAAPIDLVREPVD